MALLAPWPYGEVRPHLPPTRAASLARQPKPVQFPGSSRTTPWGWKDASGTAGLTRVRVAPWASGGPRGLGSASEHPLPSQGNPALGKAITHTPPRTGTQLRTHFLNGFKF